MACERVVIRGNDIDRVRPRFQLSRFCAWRETLLFREFSDTAAVYGFIQIAGCPCGWGIERHGCIGHRGEHRGTGRSSGRSDDGHPKARPQAHVKVDRDRAWGTSRNRPACGDRDKPRRSSNQGVVTGREEVSFVEFSRTIDDQNSRNGKLSSADSHGGTRNSNTWRGRLGNGAVECAIRKQCRTERHGAVERECLIVLERLVRGCAGFAVERGGNANPIATEVDAVDFVAPVGIARRRQSRIVTGDGDRCSDDSLTVVVAQHAVERGVCRKNRFGGEDEDWIRYTSIGACTDGDVRKRREVVETLEDDLVLTRRNAGDLPATLGRFGRRLERQCV